MNSTVVSEDSTWSIGIPASRISGSATPQFKYGGMDYDGSKITVSDTTGGLSMFVIIAIVLIVAIGAFAYFFIEFEDEAEEVQTTIRTRDRMVEKADLSKTMITQGWLGTMKKRNGSPRARIINESINALSSRTFFNRCCR